jgi:hypothetical protein
MATVKELRSVMNQVAQGLRAYDTISEEQFPKSFGITKREALLNMAKILEETAETPKQAEARRVKAQAETATTKVLELTECGGYKVDDLRAAFDMVCDKADWKGPIDSWIHATDLDLVKAAITFMTGTVATVVGTDTLNGETAYHIKAIGYRAGPCGDR